MNSNFCIKEYQNFKSFEDCELNDDAQQDTGRKSNDSRLQDIETQLELAETRCNSLKDQLNYMKQVYGGNESNDNSYSNEETDKSSQFNKASVNRQKSTAIETDTTGAAVRTINNILNGITNSVNRLSEINSQMTTPKSNMKAKEITAIPELKISDHADIKSKMQKMKVKSHRIQTSSQIAFKKTLKNDKKPRTSISRSAAILEKKSSTLVKNKYFARKFSKGNNLVEIYHNDAVKHSDSDESNMKKSRQQERMGPKINYEVPPLHIDEAEIDSNVKEVSAEKKDSSKTCHTYQNGYNHQSYFDPPEAPRTMSCCYSKNYELPTVASKMKQVAKRYLGNLNLKTIPFCAAISTTQSHNIGINIQQVLNIIKNRQPINGISPTLAHNIGLAAEKMNCKPFSALVSTINSRISQTVSKCPLSKTYLNFQQLQEQARNIPEEVIEEVDEEIIETPETKVLAITGPSGDMEVKTKNLPVWRIEKNANSEQCTCLVPSNVTFQQIATKYQKNNRTISDNNINSQDTYNPTRVRSRRYSKSTQNRLSNGNGVITETQYHTAQNNEYSESQLKGREKNLKEVLTNLHDDFENLNKKYEELCEQNSNMKRNEESLHELERLETELNKKEEEIMMVMTLYKEVMALKQQVRQLKEKKSQANISKETKTKFKEYNNPEAAFHLTKLLKQIQHYQSRYKSNLGAE